MTEIISVDVINGCGNEIFNNIDSSGALCISNYFLRCRKNVTNSEATFCNVNSVLASALDLIYEEFVVSASSYVVYLLD